MFSGAKNIGEEHYFCICEKKSYQIFFRSCKKNTHQERAFFRLCEKIYIHIFRICELLDYDYFAHAKEYLYFFSKGEGEILCAHDLVRVGHVRGRPTLRPIGQGMRHIFHELRRRRPGFDLVPPAPRLPAARCEKYRRRALFRICEKMPPNFFALANKHTSGKSALFRL